MDNSIDEDDLYFRVESTSSSGSLFMKLFEDTSTRNVIDTNITNSRDEIEEIQTEEQVDEREIIVVPRRMFRHKRGVTEDIENQISEEIPRTRNYDVYEQLDYNEEDEMREYLRGRRGKRRRNICLSDEDSFVTEDLPDLIIRPYTPEKPFEIDMENFIAKFKPTLLAEKNLNNLFLDV